MFNENNATAKFVATTKRKGESFKFQISGTVHFPEGTKKATLKANIIQNFLNEINKPIKEAHKRYTAQEVVVKIL